MKEFPFSLEQQGVHIEMINEKPWFASIDICKILNVQNPSSTIKRLDDDEKMKLRVHRSEQIQEINFISESGLYEIIFQSRKPEAIKYQKLVIQMLLNLKPKGAMISAAITYLSQGGAL